VFRNNLKREHLLEARGPVIQVFVDIFRLVVDRGCIGFFQPVLHRVGTLHGRPGSGSIAVDLSQ